MAIKKMILIYITSKDKKEAKRIATHLLKKRLIACVNMFPISSMYRWKGKLKKDGEVVLIGKTNESRFGAIKKEVKKMHSYKTPCILKIGAEANEEFFGWMRAEIK